MTRATAEILCGYFAFGAAIICGYACMKYLGHRTLRKRWSPDDVAYRRRAALASNLPSLVGYWCGYAGLAAFAQTILPGDRFYPISEALLVALIPGIAGLAFLVLDVVFPPRVYVAHRVIRPEPPPRTSPARGYWLLGVLGLAALAGSMCGIQFPLMSVGREQVVQLGQYSTFASLLWLVAATLVVKMLDGLDGAASLLLLLTAGMICYITRDTIEHLLNTFSIILVGTVLGSLRFHIYPARMSLRGGGTLFIGFLFASLTVLARQKSITAGVVIVPVLLLALLVGGIMLGFMERNLTVNRKEADE